MTIPVPFHLRLRGVSLLIIGVIVAALATPLVAFANPATRTTSDVFDGFPGMVNVVGASTLVRNDNGLSMTFRSSGLQPGTVATIWWVIFNSPENCLVPGECGLADVMDAGQVASVDISVFYAAGHVIGGSGRANYGGHLPVGRLMVDPDPGANQLIVGDGILKDARGAEVHLVLRTHGPMIPDLVHQMVKTFDAGCTTAPPALQGPNTCMNRHASVHQP